MACFYVTISVSFKRFQYFNFEKKFLENENLFKKPKYRFLVETTKIENTSFLCQKPMLRLIEWRLQNGPVTKSGALPVTTLLLWKICSSFRTS